MDGTRDRLVRLGQEVTDELAERIQYSQNPLEFRGGTPERREGGSPYWNLWFWFRGDKGVDVSVAVRSDTSDEEIRHQIRVGLERELERFGLGDRLQ